MAEDFADEVARENCMEFTDLNEDFQPFQRQYTADIIKIQEIERKIKSIEEILDEYNIAKNSDVKSHDIEEEKRPSDSSQIVEKIGKEVNDEYKSLTEQATAEKQLKLELVSQQVCLCLFCFIIKKIKIFFFYKINIYYILYRLLLTCCLAWKHFCWKANSLLRND